MGGLTVTKDVEDILGSKFLNNESVSLRLSKYLCLGENEKMKQIDAVVQCHNSNLREIKYFIHPKSETLMMELRGRLIVNQAGGVLENAGLCLHRNLNYPYIPGSAVKGCARHYAWEQWKDSEDSEEKKQTAKLIALTFGYPTGDKAPEMRKRKERLNKEEYLDNYLEIYFPELFGKDGKYNSFSGSVAFMNAVPYKKAKLVTDILTCHHMKYYNGEIPQALDNEKPNPQPFPAVEEGTTFIFQIVPIKNKADVNFAKQMLKEALEVNGIGTKTSAGYGWFEENCALREKIKKQEEEKRKLELIKAKEQKLAKEDPVQFHFQKISELDDQSFSSLAKHLEDQPVEKQKAFHKFLFETSQGKTKKKNWKKRNKTAIINAVNSVFKELNLESV